MRRFARYNLGPPDPIDLVAAGKKKKQGSHTPGSSILYIRTGLRVAAVLNFLRSMYADPTASVPGFS
eukprot:1871807-Rhodomonas_salina.1